MYNLVSINVPVGHLDDIKTPINVSDVLIDTLLRAHKRVDVVLTQDNNPQLKLWKLDSSMRFLMNPYATLGQYLQNNGDTPLPTTDISAYNYASFLRYADAFQAGYAAVPVAPGASPDLIYNDDQMTDLILTKDGIDYTLFNQSALVSINGFYHYAYANSNGVYVIDGSKGRLRTGRNLVGIHSFADVCAIQCVRLTADMVSSQGSGYNIVDGAYVNAGVDLSTSVVGLVLGGYLTILEPNILTVVGAQTVRVNMRNYPILDRFFESMSELDFSSLGLDKNVMNPTQVSPAQLTSDAVLKQYFALSTSFLVLLNKSDLFKYRYRVQQTKLMDSYISYIEPRYPLTVGRGRISEYWNNLEEDRWGLKVSPSSYPNQIYSTIDAFAQQSVANAQDPYRPGGNSPAFFTMLGRMNQIVPATT